MTMMMPLSDLVVVILGEGLGSCSIPLVYALAGSHTYIGLSENVFLASTTKILKKVC